MAFKKKIGGCFKMKISKKVKKKTIKRKSQIAVIHIHRDTNLL